MKRDLWSIAAREIERLSPIRLFVGLWEISRMRPYVLDPTNHDFLYLDNPYFGRGARSSSFRLIRRGLHLTQTLDVPGDRLKMWAPKKLDPWRKGGRSVALIPPSKYQSELYGCGDWTEQTQAKLAQITDRPVIVKDTKGDFRNWLDYHDVYAVVNWGSAAGFEAALWGFPVFSGPLCPASPVSAGPLESIENPAFPERDAWRRSLTYVNWGIHEIERMLKEPYYQ